MSYRQPLTPVPYARRTEPSRSLDQGAEYTTAVATDIRELFARVQQQMEQQCATSSQRS